VPGFSFVSGTSVGSINGAGLAMYAPEHQLEGAREVERMWLEEISGTDSIWSPRTPFGIPALWQPSFGQTRALRDLLERLVDIPKLLSSGVGFRCPAVDLHTGELIEFTGEDLGKHGIDVLLASSSFPLAFPPIEIDGDLLTDGGVRDIAPIGAALDHGAEKVIVFATRDPRKAPFMPPEAFTGWLSLLRLGMRVIDLQSLEILWNDIQTCRTMNYAISAGVPHAGHVTHVDLDVLYPSEPLGDPLAFDPTTMKAQVELGRQDALDYWTYKGLA
jgi:NTE family protein